jgi:ferredoxin
MAYVVNESCINCKYLDCVSVCPVDCFYEGENMVVIHPDECIDCGVCEPECPVDAIQDGQSPSLVELVEHNRQYAMLWPKVTKKRDPMPRAEDFRGMPRKQEAYFSPKPGLGDR